jgi:hypothetical protein
MTSIESVTLEGGGATPLKPVAKSFWGYGGVVQAPDGAIWTVATSSKKDTGPATRQRSTTSCCCWARQAQPSRAHTRA